MEKSSPSVVLDMRSTAANTVVKETVENNNKVIINKGPDIISQPFSNQTSNSWYTSCFFIVVCFYYFIHNAFSTCSRRHNFSSAKQLSPEWLPSSKISVVVHQLVTSPRSRNRKHRRAKIALKRKTKNRRSSSDDDIREYQDSVAHQKQPEQTPKRQCTDNITNNTSTDIAGDSASPDTSSRRSRTLKYLGILDYLQKKRREDPRSDRVTSKLFAGTSLSNCRFLPVALSREELFVEKFFELTTMTKLAKRHPPLPPDVVIYPSDAYYGPSSPSTSISADDSSTVIDETVSIISSSSEIHQALQKLRDHVELTTTDQCEKNLCEQSVKLGKLFRSLGGRFPCETVYSRHRRRTLAAVYRRYINACDNTQNHHDLQNIKAIVLSRLEMKHFDRLTPFAAGE